MLAEETGKEVDDDLDDEERELAKGLTSLGTFPSKDRNTNSVSIISNVIFY